MTAWSEPYPVNPVHPVQNIFFGCGFAALGNPWFNSFGCGTAALGVSRFLAAIAVSRLVPVEQGARDCDQGQRSIGGDLRVGGLCGLHGPRANASDVNGRARTPCAPRRGMRLRQAYGAQGGTARLPFPAITALYFVGQFL